MKKHLIHIALAVVGCGAHGQGTLQYDQQSSDGGPYIPVYGNIQPGPTGQSFAPSLSTIGFIQLYLSNSDLNRANETVIMYVNLWSGSLTNGNLVGQTTPASFSGSFFGPTNFFFSTPVAVTPGTTYYFQPVVPPGIGEIIGTVPGTSYPSGVAFFNGAANNNQDMWFREGIVVPEPTSRLLFMLGIVGLYFPRRKIL